jgi:hypothetical protein
MWRSSERSASREKRVPRASAADTSSSTHMGSTVSRGMRCDSNGTVNREAPNADIPKTT